MPERAPTRVEPDLSLVVPTYNEAGRLPRALERLRVFADVTCISLQVVISDDGSTDETRTIARRWIEQEQAPLCAFELVPIAHRGKGAAVRAGMLRARAPIIGYCDVDLSAGPDAIAELYARATNGGEMLMGSRGVPGSVLDIRQPLHRQSAGKLFNFLLRRLAGIAYRDTQCGLKMFRRDVAREVFRHQRLDGFAFDAEVVVLALRLGFAVEEIPIRWAHAQESKVSLARDSLRMARDTARVVRRVKRGHLHAPGLPHPQVVERLRGATTGARLALERAAARRALEAVGARGPCLDLGCASEVLPRAVTYDMAPYLVGAAPGGSSGPVAAAPGALPFPPAAFGAVVALDVLEHQARPEEMLAEVSRVLAADGVVVVSAPAYGWLWGDDDHLLGHYRRYSRPQLIRELRDAGFAVARTRLLSPRSRPAGLTLLAAARRAS